MHLAAQDYWNQNHLSPVLKKQGKCPPAQQEQQIVNQVGTCKAKPVSVCQQTVSLTELPVVYGGHLGKYAKIWDNLTPDPNILIFVSSCHIEFHSLPDEKHLSVELKTSRKQMNSETNRFHN